MWGKKNERDVGFLQNAKMLLPEGGVDHHYSYEDLLDLAEKIETFIAKIPDP